MTLRPDGQDRRSLYALKVLSKNTFLIQVILKAAIMDGLRLILEDEESARIILYMIAQEKTFADVGLFHDKTVIDYSTSYYLGSRFIRETGTTNSDREVVKKFLRRQFNILIKEGCIRKVKSKIRSKYQCVEEPKFHKKQDPQMLLPFDGQKEEENKPLRRTEIVNRIVRDSVVVAALKQLYEYRCSLCGERIFLTDVEWYCEVHHIRPLGEPHNGPDEQTNMIVLCPNHHRQFDFGVPTWKNDNKIIIGGITFDLLLKHTVDQTHINYYQSQLQIVR